jgi:hypothetical protein
VKLLLIALFFLITSFAYATDLVVSGAISPAACNGNYTANGYGGYDHESEPYSIQWMSPNDPYPDWWAIHDGEFTQFVRVDGEVVGAYQEYVGTGDVVVTAYNPEEPPTATGKIIIILGDE